MAQTVQQNFQQNRFDVSVNTVPPKKKSVFRLWFWESADYSHSF